VVTICNTSKAHSYLYIIIHFTSLTMTVFIFKLYCMVYEKCII